MAKQRQIVGIRPDLSISGMPSLKGLLGANEGKYSRLHSLADKWVVSIKSKVATPNLFFFGHNGSGKSSLACYILNSVGRGLRISMTEMLEKYFTEWKAPDIVLGEYVVVIDEVGKEIQTKKEHAEALLEYVLKYRTEHSYPTIIISNASPEDIYQRYGQTVESMVAGKFIAVPFPEVDIRRLHGKRQRTEFLNLLED